jgi:hypothetical protein
VILLLEEQLAQASPDLLRELLTTFMNTLMSADADAVRGAAYGTAGPDRVNVATATEPHSGAAPLTRLVAAAIPCEAAAASPRIGGTSCRQAPE